MRPTGGPERLISLSPGGGPAASSLAKTAVLLAGLPGWGLAASLALAEAGIGCLRLLDDGTVTDEDLAAVPLWGPKDLGRSRADALATVIEQLAPRCRVSTGPLASDPTRITGDTAQAWDLVLGAPHDGGDPAAPGLLGVARFAHAQRIPSLFAWRGAEEIALGPYTLPGRTACWNCCRLRLRALPASASQAESLEAEPRRALAAALLGARLAYAALRIVSGLAPLPRPGELYLQPLGNGPGTRHRILPLVTCHVCGGASRVTPGSKRRSPPLALPLTPSRLRRRLGGWIDPRTGPLADLRSGSSDGGAPSLPFCAVAMAATYRDDRLPPTLPDSGFGKGLDAGEAALGAVGEAIERYSAALIDPRRLRRARWAALPGEALDPRRLALYTPAQYRRPGFPYAPFAAARPLDWVAGRWLDTGTEVWVPAQLAYLSPTTASRERLCQVTSNGLAAGADLADAAGRAVLELIERDAFLLHWRARRPGRRLLLDDSLDPGAAALARDLGRRGARIEAYLLDAGIALPTVVCLGLGDGRRWPGVTLGLGCDPDLRRAARKALLEHGQTGPYLRRVVEHHEQPLPRQPQAVHQPLDHALYYAPVERAASFDFLRSGTAPPLPLAAAPLPALPSLTLCRAALAAAGVRAVLVDVTASDVVHSPFRVVRALAPGLQPLHFGHGMERLAVPRLRRLMGGALNPDPHPLC